MVDPKNPSPEIPPGGNEQGTYVPGQPLPTTPGQGGNLEQQVAPAEQGLPHLVNPQPGATPGAPATPSPNVGVPQTPQNPPPPPSRESERPKR